MKNGVPIHFTKFTGKRLRSATLLKGRLWHRRFPVNFVEFLRAPFFTDHLWWLLLWLWICFLNYKISLFCSIKLSRARTYIYNKYVEPNFYPFIWNLHINSRSTSQLLCKIGVSQYSHENTFGRASFLINIVAGLQLQPILF